MLKFNSRKDNIWFTSDTHYWHKNIVFGESDWKDKTGCRKFHTRKEMSQHIVKQINKNVKEEDELFHLGDWSFGGINNIWNFYKQLRCKNINLIVGNHDSHIINNKILPNVFWEDLGVLSEIETENSCPVKAKELFSSVEYYQEIIVDNWLICLFHYPIEEWNDRSRESIMLHGHQHGRNNNIPNRLDVGIDVAKKFLGEYRPFHWKEVKKMLDI